MGHNKYDGSILSADKLTEISNNLSEKYKNILLYFDGKTDDISEKIFLLLENIKPGDKINPTYLFIKALYELSLVADEFSYAVYNEKFEIVRDIL